jgi:uracil-DNA glycosylase
LTHRFDPVSAGLPHAWRPVLAERGVWDDLVQLAGRARRTEGIAPGADRIFRALDLVPPDAVRVVILGQDPYPTPGHADGLCFSVRPGVAPPRSLKNIFREMADDLGVRPSSHGDLESWARQGVLLLNTVLTVGLGAANSHSNWGWQRVTDGAIAAVAELPQPVVFLLWGKSAEAKSRLIGTGRHLILTCAHPSPLSARRGFFGCRHFSKSNAWLVARGAKPVDWTLPAVSA